MFEIKVGTIIPAVSAEEMLPILNPMGFESYELSVPLDMGEKELIELAGRVNELTGSAVISSLGVYGNPLGDDVALESVRRAIDCAGYFGCSVIGMFAGRTPGESVKGSIPRFKTVYSELARRAESRGVKLAFEGCGGGWNGGDGNIAYCPSAWELMFDAVPSDALGLEWEPAHAICQLMDPIAQLRHWAKKVHHVHAKDGTTAWDVIREYGLDSGHAWHWDRTPGFGDTNWNDIFTILLQAGYNGYVDIEGYHDPVHYDDGEWSAQARALAYLKDCRGGRVFIEGPGYKGYQPPKSSAASRR